MTNEAPKSITKQTIWEDLKKAQAVLEANGIPYNPQLEAKVAKEQSAVANAVALTHVDVETQIIGLGKNIESYLSDVTSRIKSQVKEFSSVEEAIIVKRRELEEVYGIETELQSLAAILNVKHSSSVELDALKLEIADAQAQLQKSLDFMEAEAKKIHDRKVADWEYDHKTTTKRAEAEHKAKLDAMDRDHQEKVDANHRDIAIQREQLKAKSDGLDAIAQKLDAREVELESDFKSRVSAVESHLKSESDKAIHLASLESQYKIERLEDQLKAANESNEKLEAKVNDLQHKLDGAYKNIQEVAVKASTRVVDATK